MLGWLPERSAPRRAVLSSRIARTTDAPLAFTARQLARRRGLFGYRIRGSDVAVLVRHNTIDIWTLGEIFLFEVYRPPVEISDRIAGQPGAKIIDLGANVGLFGAYIYTRFPEARVVGFEPDPENAAVHRAVISRNALSDRWTLVPACAGTEDGTVQFTATGDTFSHIEGDPTASSSTVRIVDVLPEMASASLVKIDIEGGEWPILADPRLAQVESLVMEYHPHLCPAEDPLQHARDLLEENGFSHIRDQPGTGSLRLLWAWRDSGQRGSMSRTS